MGGTQKSLGLIRRAAWPALALIIVGTFAGHAVPRPNGILAWGSYHHALQQRQERASGKSSANRLPLKHRSNLLDPQEGRPRHGR